MATRKKTTAKKAPAKRKALPKKKVARKASNGRNFTPTEDQRIVVSALALVPIKPQWICKTIINAATNKPIGLETLYKHFAEELQGNGAATAALAMSTLVRNMKEGGRTGNAASMFILKTRFGFHERLQLEDVGGLEKLPEEDVSHVAQSVLTSSQQQIAARAKLNKLYTERPSIDDEPGGTA